MRSHLLALAGLVTATALAAAPAALAAPAQPLPAFANPGDAAPSLSLAVSPGGEPEAATMGAKGSLWYSFDKNGWHRSKVAGADSAFSGPSIFAGQFGAADIAVQGPSNTLQFYALSKGRWHHTQVAGKGSAFSAPSLAMGPHGPGIAVVGASHALWYYALSGGRWHASRVSPAGSAFSAPSMVIRTQSQANAGNPAGQVDIAVELSNHKLGYYSSRPGGHWQAQPVGTAGSAFSAPSLIVVRGPVSQGVAYIAAQGQHHSLSSYNNSSGWLTQLVAGNGRVFSAPSVAQGDSLRQVGIAFRGSSSSLSFYFFDTMTFHWVNDVIVKATGTVSSAPALIFQATNPPGRDDIIFQGTGNTLWYYFAPRPKQTTQVPNFRGTKIAGAGTTFGG